MPKPIFINANVLVPADALEVRAVRSSGPGGQNVNKVSSKVELRVDLWRVTGLTQAQLERLLQLAASWLDAEGKVLVTSQRTRDQRLNLSDAEDKVRELILRALVVPKARRKT